MNSGSSGSDQDIAKSATLALSQKNRELRLLAVHICRRRWKRTREKGCEMTGRRDRGQLESNSPSGTGGCDSRALAEWKRLMRRLRTVHSHDSGYNAA
jgi:hypothetical protein